jgi:serine O-acetyltransferase
MSTAVSNPPSHFDPLPQGARNENPRDIGLLELIAEDFRTHNRSLGEAGFWAVALHRLGNARMDVRPRWLRAPLSATYNAAFLVTDWLLGIELPYTVRLGRRVRIWHHGGIVISARAIGNDVHIRHNTTLGVVRRDELGAVPIIGDGVDIGVGACILGPVTVGDGSAIGASSVVLHDVPPGATAVGAPARLVLKGKLSRTNSSTRLRAISVAGGTRRFSGSES